MKKPRPMLCRRAIVRVAAVVVLNGVAATASATHFRYGHITWTPDPVDPLTIEYTITNAWRRDAYNTANGRCIDPTVDPPISVPCTGPDGNVGVGDVFQERQGAPQTRFNPGDGTGLIGSAVPIGSNRGLLYLATAVDPSQNWVLAVALDPSTHPQPSGCGLGNTPSTCDTTVRHTYAAAGTYTARIDRCCRTEACEAPEAHINNPETGYRVATVVDVGSGNSSPASSLPPIVSCPENGLCVFSIPVSDNELDAVSFRLATSAEAGFDQFLSGGQAGQGQPGTAAGCATDASVDPATGVFSWDTTGCTLAGDAGPPPPVGGCGDSALNTVYSTQVLIEEPARGTVVPLDFFIRLAPAACPVPGNVAPGFDVPPSPCGQTFGVAPNEPVSFTVSASDSSALDVVSLNAAGLPTGAVLTPTLPQAGNPVSTQFSWTPTDTQKGQHVLVFQAQDTCGLQALCSVTIDVSDELCGDGADNDGDGLVDCDDPDCNATACDDGDPCTYDDVCSGGVCQGAPACGNGVLEPACGEECDPPDGVTCTSACEVVVCGDGVVELTEECDDGNTTDGDCCSSTCRFESGPCDDGDVCTEADTCSPLGCLGVPVDCSGLDGACTVGVCNATTGACEGVPANEGGACDDGDVCTFGDVCVAGVCVGGPACGNGTVEPVCGEECDPPDGVTCDPTCQDVICGDGSVQVGEECDDGNTTPGDGCGPTCQFEDKFCLIGERPAVGRMAKRVVFVSEHDYLGTNGDGNAEIFFFDKKKFDKALKKRVRGGEDPSAAAADLLTTQAGDFFEQLTDTTTPVVNEQPTINGNGRAVAWVSTGDPLGANADGNKEIFRLDRKRLKKGDPTAFVQVTGSTGAENQNPNLRAMRGNLLIFDSDADLAPGRCVGGKDEGASCTSDAECAGPTPDKSGVCGNPEQNRELFVFVHAVARAGGEPLRQLTATPSGSSVVGRSVNFNTRVTAFSSTGDIRGLNPEGNAEIFRIARSADSVVAVTSTTSGQASEPAQSKRSVVVFVSNGDPLGTNPDGNDEIFVWRERGAPQLAQLTQTAGCANRAPSVDDRGRFVVFESTCDLIPSVGNPDRSIYIWDGNNDAFLPLVVRGPTSTASAGPLASRRVKVLTFEGNLGSAFPAVCFLNTKDELLEVLGP